MKHEPTTTEVVDLLDAAGAPRTSRLDPDFVDGLETRLRAVHALRDVVPAPVSPPMLGSRRRALVVVAAAATLALLVSVVLVMGETRDAGALRITRAVDTTVELPDGRVVAGRAGLRIPDGATVRTGPGGRAVLGDVVLGPNDEAVVRGGTVVTVPPLSESTGSKSPPPGGAAAPAPPPPAPKSVTPPPGVVVPPPAPPSPVTQPPPVEPPVVSLTVSGTVSGSQGTLTWSRYDGPDFSAYLVLGAYAPTEPVYPPTGATVVAVRISDRNRLTYTSPLPPGRPVAVRVVAVGANGHLRAISPVVTATGH